MKYLLTVDGRIEDVAESESEAMWAAEQLTGDVEIFVQVATKGVREF